MQAVTAAAKLKKGRSYCVHGRSSVRGAHLTLSMSTLKPSNLGTVIVRALFTSASKAYLQTEYQTACFKFKDKT
jgi:hypothetical protein